MNKNLKEKMITFATEFSCLKSLINILENLIYECDRTNLPDIMNLCSTIAKNTQSAAVHLEEIEKDLKL